MRNIAVIGAGSMGCAMAARLAWNGHSVALWSPVADEIEMLKTNDEHLTRLPGVRLPDGILYSVDLAEVLKGKDCFVLAIPSQTTRENMKRLKESIKPDSLLVTCSKGIEDGTGKLLTEIMEEEMPQARVAALSGPSHAEEIARKVPTVVVSASKDMDIAEEVQDIFMSEEFRVYTNTDVVGVELGAALKNVIALCAGISDGLGFGDNTKAALMTRGMAEIARMGLAIGSSRDTFFGLTGMGDLIVTCTSMHSRNRRAGILIGQGVEPLKALDEVKMVVEGYATCKPAYELARKMRVSMPIIQEAYEILYNGKDPREAVVSLMTRDKRTESDFES